MRSILIPTLLLITGMPMLADGRYQEWKHRSHDWCHQEYRDDAPRWGYPSREDYRRHYLRYQREGVATDQPEPVIIHVRPEPAFPPPVSIHLWFGF